MANKYNMVDLNKIADGSKKYSDGVVDTTKNIDNVIKMTPKEGYQAKIRIIEKAKDMSSIEKINQICEADKTYQDALLKNEHENNKMIITRICIYTSVLIIMGATTKYINSNVSSSSKIVKKSVA